MYRIQYRNFGTYESLVVNHSLQVSSSSNQTGVRWYEIRNPNGDPFVTQQSTYSPDSTTYRWMGIIAQDGCGNMAVGYSGSSLSNPGIVYAGRGAGDTANTMSLERTIWTGTGSQTSYSRWEDYSSMAIDPAEDMNNMELT